MNATNPQAAPYHPARNPPMRAAFPLLPSLGLVLLLASSAGCGRSLLPGSDAEGVIEYAMSFPDMDPNGLMADMLPDKTVLSFNRMHQSVELSAGMGVFKTCMLVNTPGQVVDYHMSIMGKSLMAEFRRRDLHSLNNMPPPISVINTFARDTIAGLPCKQAYLIFDGIDAPEAEVWYTESIPLENPNWFGPFYEIPGVLMRYELVQHNIKVRFEAQSVRFGGVDQAKFAARPDHQRVSPEVLYQQLDEVLGTFSN